MRFGTNDVWSAIAASKIREAYSAVLAKLRSVSSHVVLFVARIISLPPNGRDHCDVTPLNGQLPGWAEQNGTTESPINVVDQYTGFSCS
jgi:hypothetical protein